MEPQATPKRSHHNGVTKTEYQASLKRNHQKATTETNPPKCSLTIPRRRSGNYGGKDQTLTSTHDFNHAITAVLELLTITRMPMGRE